VIDAHLTGRTPVAPDAFAADMHSAAFTHRSDAGAVIDLQKKVFLEKVTRRRKLKVEGISLQQMQALTQSLRHFEQLNSITLNDFRCGNNEATSFVEALATTPIKKISCKTRDQSSLDCLVKAMAVASKTLKITHLDLACEFGAKLGASGAEVIAVFLKSTTTLVNLDLSKNYLCNIGAEVLAEALKENRTLKRLNLDSNDIGFEGVQAIAVFLKSTTTLVNLDLSYNSGNRGVQVLAEALKENRTLKRLNLDSNDIGVEGVQALQQALETNTTLEHLELYENGYRSPGADEAIEAACRANPRIRWPWAVYGKPSEASDGSEEQALKSPFEAAVWSKGLADQLRLNRIITKLHLFSKDICDEQLKALADAFLVNKTIKEVFLSDNQIGDEGVKALAYALHFNKTIKAVNLSFNKIGDEGVKALADAFLVNKTIKEVYLTENQISAEGVKALADAFRVNKTIGLFHLEGNQIADEGVKALADAFLVNKTIETVNLSYNQIGDEGVKALADAFLVNKTIETVNLSYNQIGDEGVKALASALEINEFTEVLLHMNEDQLAMLSDEGRQALSDIQRFCNRNKERKWEAAVRNRQCFSGHDLRLEEVPYGGACDRCRGSLSQGERVHRCAECKFDLCPKCLEIPEDAPVGSIVPTNAET